MRRIENNCDMAASSLIPEILSDPRPDSRLSVPTRAALVLPGESLSVPALFQHRLPNPLWTIYRSEISPWSTSPADSIDPTILDNHIIPPKAVLDHLLSKVTHLAPTIQSVRRTAILPDHTLPEHLPIWILSFWQKIYEARQLRSQWKTCHEWVASKPRVSTRVQDQLERTLINIRWRGSLNGRRRDRSVDDIFDLLSNKELNSGQVDDLLELVERDLLARSDGTTPPLIASTDLAHVLNYAHEQRESHDFQKTWIQATVEKTLTEKRKSFVASVAWISLSGRGHWVPYTVNPRSSSISYGDPLGGPIPMDLFATLQWWLLDLRRMMGLSTDNAVTLVPLSVTPQTDGFSCGILSTNAIGHHLHGTFPLVGRDPASIKAYRIERTIEILTLDGEFVRVNPEQVVWSLTSPQVDDMEVFELSFRSPSPLNFPPESSPMLQPSSPMLRPSSPVLQPSSPPQISSPIPQTPSQTFPLPQTHSPPPHSSPLLPASPDLTAPSLTTLLAPGKVTESPKQKMIDQFFTAKLSKEESHEQAQRRLTRTAEEREDWLDEEECRRKRAKITRQEANKRSQRGSRARKRTKEIAAGVRDADGKIKKVCRHTQ